MTELNNAAATPATDAQDSKAKTVKDDMPSRRLFNSTDEAAAYYAKCQEDFVDFADTPIIAAGFLKDENGEDSDFDPEVYTDEMRVAIAKLTTKGTATTPGEVKAIVIYPAPKVSAILGISEDELQATPGFEWLNKIAEKELNHIAVQQLRKAETREELQEAKEAMPLTVADFLASGRETSSGILETFNATWQLVKKGIASKSKPFALANLSKKELRKGMESASYAGSIYPKLELRTDKAGNPASLFVMAANFGKMIAEAEGLDPAFYDRALANRDEKTIEIDEDEEDFDLEAMAAAMTSKDEDDASTETEDGEGES